MRDGDDFDVVALLTSITSGYDRVSIHGVRRELVEAQAASLGLPLFEVALAQQSSNDAYEAAFTDALARLRLEMPAVRHVAFGDLYLADVRAYRERLVLAMGMTPVFPLWGKDTRALAAEFITAGYVAHLVCIDTQQLPAAFAGRRYDASLVGALPDSADPCGEGGEFHTFVSAGPIFARALPVVQGETVLRDERFAFSDLLLQPER